MESSSEKVEASPRLNLQQCSVCLDPVGMDAKERSIAKLKCGHLFHLDCIGSSHNAKGKMQCPNCRDIEHGNWYYASGIMDPEDITFDDAFHEEDYMVDMNPYIEVYESHQHFNPFHWCPFDGPYPQMPLQGGELEIAAVDYPGTLVAFVCENAPSTCPFLPVNESQSSRHPTGYDPMVRYDSVNGALQHMQSDSVGGEVARHGTSQQMQSESLEDGLRRELTRNQRPLPYRFPSDLGVTQRHMDVASPSTVWSEPNAQVHFQRGPRPLHSSGSFSSGLGSSSGSNSRYRGIGGPGRTGQMNESRGQFHVGIAPSSGGQDTGIASVPGTNWQGDQGIPWRRDTFSDYPWATSEPPFWRWSCPALRGSNTSSYQGVNGLQNGALRSAPGLPGYPSTFQHDGSRVVGSMIPQSTRRPR